MVQEVSCLMLRDQKALMQVRIYSQVLGILPKIHFLSAFVKLDIRMALSCMNRLDPSLAISRIRDVVPNFLPMSLPGVEIPEDPI